MSRGAAAAVVVDEDAVAAARELLTPLERAYCHGRRRPAQHLAGRIAAKRAVVTLFERAGEDPPDLGGFELAPGVPPFPVALAWQPSHRPVCRPVDPDRRLAAGLATVRVSISHCGDLAVAAAATVARDPGATTWTTWTTTTT